MKQLLTNLYKYLYNTEILPAPTIPVVAPKLPPVKSNGEKLLDYALTFHKVDPTPNDEVPDGYACVHSLTTILNGYFKGDFPVLTYTPILLEQLKADKRFKRIESFKVGSIVLSPTGTGNGSVVGHVGLTGYGEKILSNSSETGLWDDRFTQTSWIDRYSKRGGLDIHIFELVV